MKLVARAGLAALLLLALVAPRGYSGAPEVSDWTVTGLENQEGAYTGTAHLELQGIHATISVSATTATGATISWSGTGKLESGMIAWTVDAGATLPGAGSGAKVKALSVLNDDGSLSGYWQVQGAPVGPKATGKAQLRPGGTDTFTLAGGTPLPGSPDLSLPAPRLPADALPVPCVTQPDEYGCGASSLQAVLYYYRVSDGDLRTLYKPLGTNPKMGTDSGPIVAYAKNQGLTARSATNASLDDLRASLANRDPVMLAIQAWREKDVAWVDDTEDGHWVVLVGMDATYAYFMDPWAHFGPGYLPLTELLERWHCSDQHEAVFFHGLAPHGDGLVRMR